uniref:Uncharacterized protein n=1 Tax=Molossus molossus TaxID=27622 RepID=A0A7J8E344_MOLMO|nr:hypothetical protein HJG59_008954 [Molossus molossus]
MEETVRAPAGPGSPRSVGSVDGSDFRTGIQCDWVSTGLAPCVLFEKEGHVYDTQGPSENGVSQFIATNRERTVDVNARDEAFSGGAGDWTAWPGALKKDDGLWVKNPRCPQTPLVKGRPSCSRAGVLSAAALVLPLAWETSACTCIVISPVPSRPSGFAEGPSAPSLVLRLRPQCEDSL